MQIIDAQYILETYAREITTSANGKIINSQSREVHLLIISDPDSSISYKIRYGGAINPRTADIPGYAIPLILNLDIPMYQTNDHAAGCSLLDYETNPDLVIRYVNNVLDTLNTDIPAKKMYLDSGLKFSISKEDYSNIFEGVIPVFVNGVSITGINFQEPVRAYIITGNCK